MKEDEKLFFVLCFQLRMLYGIDVRKRLKTEIYINSIEVW